MVAGMNQLRQIARLAALPLWLAGCQCQPGPEDALDAGRDAGRDAGLDAGADAGLDAGGPDAGIDGGPDASTPEPALIRRTFTELDGGVLNPERGFYDVIDLTSGSSFASVRAAGMTLALAGIRLDAYRQAPIDAALLTSIEAGLGSARTAGIKIILRFQYNDGPIGAADASRTQILAHLAQLQPLLSRNADVIALMQAGFIGAWGEWHSSTHGLDNPADRQAVLTGILAALPASRMVQVRTPNFVDDLFPGGALDAGQAFSGSPLARTGHHNDCFLASADDFGTYPAPVEAWKDYVAAGGRFTPVGGETCALNPPRSACPTATAELERLHFRFLNSLYHPGVLGSWTTGGCLSEIRARLGYRFVLEELSHSAAVRPGGVLRLQGVLRNDGYGALFNARPLEVVLEQGASRLAATLGTIDVRRWERGPHSFDVRLRLPASLSPGTYRLSLALPDADPKLSDQPAYAVQLANAGVWDPARGLNLVVPQLSIDATAGGQTDPAATAFTQLP
ncbi:MAG: hypothetical protein H6Q89_2897 [Myxococcaceae bacterium]|nr:hypothetical protein [Myxococcaceae bacterium]